jgi:hypothetical protein
LLNIYFSLDEQCDIILKKCQGIDDSIIIDDQGSLSKTLSVENSFRRGTMTNPNDIIVSMESLYSRLCRLVNQRIRQYHKNTPTVTSTTHNGLLVMEYPNTIKVTIRFVMNDGTNDENNKNNNMNPRKRHPTVTRSQQLSWDNGKKLMYEGDMMKQIQYLRQGISPILRSLMIFPSKNNGNHLDVTRINIALTNFVRDKAIVSTHAIAESIDDTMTIPSQMSSFRLTSPLTPTSINSTNHVTKIKYQTSNCHEKDPLNNDSNIVTLFPPIDEIDPHVLSELPIDIRNEVMTECINRRHHHRDSQKHNDPIIHKAKKNRLKTINDYFIPTTPQK